MSRTIGLISELEVVNSVLSVAGDSPVQSLDDEYQPVFIIKQMIIDVSRKMQSKPLWFNTEEDVELTQNTVTKKTLLPFNILRFEPQDTRYVQRGTIIYDRVDRTTNITSTVVADISVQLLFEELPQSAREVIRAACRLQYNTEYFGDNNSKRELSEALNDSIVELAKEDIENSDINMFSSSKVNNIAFKNRTRG